MTTATLTKETFNWDDLLTVQKFSSLLSWQEAMQHTGRHGIRGAESSYILMHRQQEMV